MRYILAAFALFLLAIGPNAASADGPAIVGARHAINVIDGDTLQIGSMAVQLAGIDAPELGQVCTRADRAISCGLLAARALRKIVATATQPIVCSPMEHSSGATIATCVVGDRDVSRTLIEGGYAIALSDSPPDYRVAEKQTKSAGIGLWGGAFRAPAVWRGENRALVEASRTAGICLFYGHTDEQGRRLYYGPLDAKYQRVIGDTRQSGPLFCSDEEARESGWRYNQVEN